MGPAGLISGFALDSGGFPEAVHAAATRSILDVLAVTVAGSQSETARRARAALLTGAGGDGGVAAVVGTGIRTSPSLAALLNGVAAHALDFDDVWADDDGVKAWRGHPSVCVLPAVMAAAELVHAAGDDLLAGYVVGTEVAGKLGTAFGPGLGRAGWHPTVVLGTIAAAAGAGRVLELDADALERSLGLAASEASGLHRNFGTDTKPFHAGHAARCGLDAALLARAGFTANPGALEDYARVFGAAPAALAATLGELGLVYDLVAPGLSVKKYPCCRFAHLPLDALFEALAAHPVDPAEVDSITVRIEPNADDALVCPGARTGLEGKFSLPYTMAAGTLDGRLTLASFTDSAVQRPAVRRLMSVVRTHYRSEPGAEVEVSAGGRSVARRALVVRGDPANPLSPAEELDKCRICVAGVLQPTAADRLVESVRHLRELGDAGELTAQLQPGATDRPGSMLGGGDQQSPKG